MGKRISGELRRRIAAIHRRRRPTGRRYPAELRAAVVSHARAARSAGVSVRATAKALGVPYPTLAGWLHDEPVRFREVAVGRPFPEVGRGLHLVTAQGHRVEGLNREDLAFVLQRLGG
jgi:hypothetical protein